MFLHNIPMYFNILALAVIVICIAAVIAFRFLENILEPKFCVMCRQELQEHEKKFGKTRA